VRVEGRFVVVGIVQYCHGTTQRGEMLTLSFIN